MNAKMSPDTTAPLGRRANAGRAAILATLLLGALAASGCGRRGPLEPPPDAAAAAVKPVDTDPTQLHGRKKPPPITPPNASFVLDPLL